MVVAYDSVGRHGRHINTGVLPGHTELRVTMAFDGTDVASYCTRLIDHAFLHDLVGEAVATRWRIEHFGDQRRIVPRAVTGEEWEAVVCWAFELRRHVEARDDKSGIPSLQYIMDNPHKIARCSDPEGYVVDYHGEMVTLGVLFCFMSQPPAEAVAQVASERRVLKIAQCLPLPLLIRLCRVLLCGLLAVLIMRCLRAHIL